QQADLVFYPHQCLHYLPCHAMFDGDRYLIDRFCVRYAPSASIYRLFLTREREYRRKAVLFGLSDSRAPFIEDEIHSIREVIPHAQTYLGCEATAERLFCDMESAGLIHIVSHARFGGDGLMF